MCSYKLSASIATDLLKKYITMIFPCVSSSENDHSYSSSSFQGWNCLLSSGEQGWAKYLISHDNGNLSSKVLSYISRNTHLFTNWKSHTGLGNLALKALNLFWLLQKHIQNLKSIKFTFMFKFPMSRRKTFIRDMVSNKLGFNKIITRK